MTIRVVIRKGAKQDIKAARAWYDAQRPGLGTEFLDAVAHAVGRMAAGPLRYPIVEANAHRLIMPRFPYSIYFRLRDDEVRIIAVLHQHRDPDDLRRSLAR